MRSATLLLVPLFLFACDREPVAPEGEGTPQLGATHETLPFTVYDLDWYTSMPCLGYHSPDPTCPSCPDLPNAVHWTAGWVAYNDMYLYLPHDQRPHNRWTAVISDDVQFETPTGDVWKPVPNIYNFVGWASLDEVIPWIPASASQHEQLVFERTDGARMKITHTNHMVTNGTGELVVENSVWDCNLTRPGK
jgi:hypothetical protein